MQAQIRRRRTQNAASDQGLQYLHTEISIKNKIKMRKFTIHPLNEKCTHPINKDGIVHWAKKGLISFLKKRVGQEFLFIQETAVNLAIHSFLFKIVSLFY